MKKLCLSVMAVILISGFAICVQAQDAVDMTGTWEMTVVTANGTGNPTFELKQEGGKLTGTYSGRFGEEDVEGKVTGNKFEIHYESSGVPVTYSGTVNGDKIEGDVDFSSYGTGTFTGER